MIDARRTELLTIRIEHGDRTAPSDLISALQTIPDGWVINRRGGNSRAHPNHQARILAQRRYRRS